MKLRCRPVLKNIVLLFFLLLYVGLVNFSVISLDLMYPEQSLIYLANQSIHSMYDLFQVYLHPKMFHLAIPFFRPSGHFLMYQLLTPLLGWHNTKGFIMVNLCFLALVGYMLIKFYTVLFPGYKLGGYLAFSLYAMYPALILARLMALHFEFAYIFFVMLSLYYFVLFCRANSVNFQPSCSGESKRATETTIQKSALFMFSLLFFAIAITFKESALMLGPVLAVYFLISIYNGTPALKFLKALLKSKQALQILIFLTIVTLILALYLSLQWPSYFHPIRSHTQISEKLKAATEFLRIIFNLPSSFLVQKAGLDSNLAWRDLVVTPGMHFIVGIFYLLLLGSTVWIFYKRDFHGKNLLFLYLASYLFLLLPLNWGMAFPWHLSLTLLFLSMAMGFSCEYICRRILKKQRVVYLLSIVVMIIGFNSMSVNQANINQIRAHLEFLLVLDHDAVLQPPDIKNKLKVESILVVENRILQDPYLLGASVYPYQTPNLGTNKNIYQQIEKNIYTKFDLVYNGTLFRWAYLMPNLREEVYPFQINHMETVPNGILYNWVQQYPNIFCLGYDDNAKWYDRTLLFKEAILKEKKKRGLVVNSYARLSATSLVGNSYASRSPGLPEPMFCELDCDQTKKCKGFTYEKIENKNYTTIQCHFFDYISKTSNKVCAACVGYIKNNLKENIGKTTG